MHSNEPSLSPRLSMVASLLPTGRRLIDIGTDHAYLPIIAIQRNRYEQAVAADIRPGPLAVAERNIRRFACADRVTTVLSNGLNAFECRPGDVVVMAGLGGLEMIDILEAASARWPILVLQPQKSDSMLRAYLSESGYSIRSEALCSDDRRLYVAVVAECMSEYVAEQTAEQTAEIAPLSPIDQYIGPCLRRDRPPFFPEWLNRQRVQVLHAIRRGEPLTDVLLEIDRLLAETHIDENAR